ncbi:MAG TPA: hypothetical protein VFV98_05910, partial [Vicinamibacterales bacterium]|nr:hypothetical protein [Vicinamibacterales bacterium]
MIEFVSAASTGARELHFTPAGGKPRVFQRADVLMLSSAELQQFAGDYVSPEIQVTYTVVARQGDLMVQRPGRAAIILRPLLPDAFTGAVLGVVTFSRDAQGAITGFAVNLTGVRGLRFDRVKQAG